MGKLSEAMRIKLALCAELTYAATARAICDAIRKLARVSIAPADGVAGGDERLRWRGVRGALPPSFFEPSLGLITATELGLMSTSTNFETPLHYMRGTSNVMWELRTRAEDEQGFHSGADVSCLSQFAGEQEELFPPLTMLRVAPRVRRLSGERACGREWECERGA